MRLLKKLTAAADALIGFSGFLTAILLLFSMLAINAQIAVRVFGSGLLWIMEVCEYALLYMTFLGAAWLLRREGHVRMDLVLARLRPAAQATANIVTSILGIFISGVLTWWGAVVTLEHYRQGYFLKTVLEPPTWPLMIVIPFGSFLLTIQFIRRTHHYVRVRQTVAKIEREPAANLARSAR